MECVGCCVEMSHRGSDFTQIMDAAEASLRQLLWVLHASHRY